MTRRPLTLTTRLVVTTVALVALVAALIGTATALAIRGYLSDRLDDEVRASARALLDGEPGDLGAPGDLGDPGGRARADGRFDDRNQAPGTLNALFTDRGVVVVGEVLARREADERTLAPEAVERLRAVPTDGDVRTVDLSGLGDYRVVAVDVTGAAAGAPFTGVLVTGLPTDEVEETVADLARVELVVAVLAVLAAAGAALVVVRRQLRPLRQMAGTAATVATLPLAEGEIRLSERVPEQLTDARTEVGRVGSSLNALLAHVESSLAARQRSEQQVRQFVADASHELRTPLATIKGYAELARRRPDETAAVLTALAKVEGESTRMTALVEDLLLLARLDAGRPLEREPVDLTRLLLEAVADARVLAPEHHWRLDLPAESLEVVGDEQRLHQAVTNLLTNARRHTPPGTTVSVTGRPGRVVVADDGPGFPPELVPRAFERFARGDDARSRGGSSGDAGTGLGLALVAAIVAAHGGRVDLASTPGHTRVTVELPSPRPM